MPDADRLDQPRYLTLIARLLLDASGEVLSGDLADTDGRSIKRFFGRRGLYEALESCLDDASGPESEAGSPELS